MLSWSLRKDTQIRKDDFHNVFFFLQRKQNLNVLKENYYIDEKSTTPSVIELGRKRKGGWRRQWEMEEELGKEGWEKWKYSRSFSPKFSFFSPPFNWLVVSKSGKRSQQNRIIPPEKTMWIFVQIRQERQYKK